MSVHGIANEKRKESNIVKSLTFGEDILVLLLCSNRSVSMELDAQFSEHVECVSEEHTAAQTNVRNWHFASDVRRWDFVRDNSMARNPGKGN